MSVIDSIDIFLGHVFSQSTIEVFVAPALLAGNGDSWHGVLVRTGAPPDIIARLAAESQKIIDSEDFRKKLRDYGLAPAGGTPAEFGKFISDDSRAWAKVVKDNDIKVE